MWVYSRQNCAPEALGSGWGSPPIARARRFSVRRFLARRFRAISAGDPKVIRREIFFGFALLLVFSISSEVYSEEIVLASAVSLREPMEEIVSRFEVSHPDSEVRIVFGASSTIARQIEFGAPIEIFISADARWVDYLVRLSRVDKSDTFSIGSNRLVVINKKGAALDIESGSDLVSGEVERVALPPESVPLGRYARVWLDGQGLSGSIDSRAIVTEHARATTAAVEHGHADAAIVYRTDALGSSEVEISFEIPAVDQPEIIYSAALLRPASKNKNAQEFFAYLKTPETSAILEQAGFGLLRASTGLDPR